MVVMMMMMMMVVMMMWMMVCFLYIINDYFHIYFNFVILFILTRQKVCNTYGLPQTTSGGQGPMTRAIVATQMLALNKNGIMEFKDVPFIGDVSLVDSFYVILTLRNLS